MKISYGELWDSLGNYPARITYYLSEEKKKHTIEEPYEMEDFFNKMKSRQLRMFYIAPSRVCAESLELTVSVL